MLKTIFHEVIGSRITGNFAQWLKSKGYDAEGTIILEALASWLDKEIKRLKNQQSS